MPTIEEELAALVGGRIQKADVVADRELVMELRFPGRTVRLLLCWRPGAGRIHVIQNKPPRLVDGGDLQRAIRKRIEGRALIAIHRADAHTIWVEVEGAKMEAKTKQGTLAFLAPTLGPARSESSLPDHFPVSEALENQYGTRTEDDAARLLRDALAKSLKEKKKKLERLAQNLTKDLDRLASMEKSRHHGELLKTQLAKIPRGATEANVTDWESGEEIAIALDPAIGPKQNMERLFQRAKKAERGRPIVGARLDKTNKELAAIATAKEEIDRATFDALVALAQKTGYGSGGLIEAKEKPHKKKPIEKVARRFFARDGSEIWVGKGAKENDRLTFSFAKGDDVWMHASGAAGAHVLVRADKSKPASAIAMEDAALLAAHYSGAREHADVEIVWTEARWVKKSKGDPPGRVSVAKPRSMRVIVDKARLDALFGRTL